MRKPLTVMRAVRALVFSLVSLLVFSSPSLNEVAAAGQTSASRPSFTKRSLVLGDKKIQVEVADSDEKRSYGLMFRETMPDNVGMLFIFDNEAPRSFWMKNTLIPLSIAYFDRDKILREIIDMEPAPLGTARPKSYPSRTNSMFALEMNRGWFERNEIRPGVRFRYADN